VFCLSFLASILFVEISQSSAFYLLPFRAWELCAGALLASGISPKHRNPRIQALLFYVGLALIIASFIFIDSKAIFPGYLALIPVLGAFLVISSSLQLRNEIGMQALRSPPIVIIGLLSYALYLWHWPIIVFYKYYFNAYQLEAFDCVIIVIATFALSWISTFLIEPKIRKQNISSRFIVISALSFSLIFLAIGLHIKATNGASYRFELSGIYDQSRLDEKEYLKKLDKSDCSNLFDSKLNSGFCTKYGAGKKIDIVIWGDSHARDFGKALATIYDSSFIVISTSGCPPLIGVKRHDIGGNSKNCKTGIQSKIAKKIREISPSSVVIISRWGLYHHGWKNNGILKPNTHFLCDTNCQNEASDKSSLTVMQRSFVKTLKTLTKTTKVIVVKSVPTLTKRGDDLVRMPSEQRGHYIPSYQNHKIYQYEENRLIDLYKNEIGYSTLDPAKTLCSTGKCALFDRSHIYYFDDNRLTMFGWLSMKNEIISLLPSKN
jgi:hypothetical protein